MHRWMIGGGVLVLAVLAVGTAEAADYWGTNLPSITIQTGTLIMTNAGTAPQTATVYDSTGMLASLIVPPGASQSYTMTNTVTGTGIYNVGAYRVNTTDDVFVTEFMPITDVFSNDAFRLLRDDELGTAYYVFSHDDEPVAGETAGDDGSSVTVVATEDGTTVTVTVAADVQGGGAVPFLPAGTTTTFNLNAYQLLNLFSAGSSSDLTGTYVVANKDVAVFGGHQCVNIGNSACDHISEQMFPALFADREYPVCASQHMRSGAGYDELRIMATRPGTTTVTVAPLGTTFTLSGAGDWQPVYIQDDQYVTANQPVLVGQYYGDSNQNGDPAYILLNPRSAFRDEQVLHLPPGWTDYVIIAAPSGTTSNIGATPVGGWRPIGTSGYSCSTTSSLDGDIFVTSNDDVSVQVLGIGFATSYWYLADVGRGPPPQLPCEATATVPDAPTSLLATPTGPLTVDLTWGPPASDGGCPLMGYRLYRAEGAAPFAVIANLPGDPPPTMYSDAVPRRCTEYWYYVVAYTSMGDGPPSVTDRFDTWEDDECDPPPPPPPPPEPEPEPEGQAGAPGNADSDSDGVPDAHDACPGEPGGGTDGCPTPAATSTTTTTTGPPPGVPPPPPCRDDMVAPRAVSAALSDDDVTVSWTYEGTCTPVRFFIWNGTDELVAVVTMDESYTVTLEDAGTDPRRYWVQTATLLQAPAFEERLATASNPVGQASSTTTAGPETTGGGEASAWSILVPVGLVVLIVSGGLLGVLFWRRRKK